MDTMKQRTNDEGLAGQHPWVRILWNITSGGEEIEKGNMGPKARRGQEICAREEGEEK